MHFTRVINLQCARIRQTIVNETSSREKDRSSQNRDSEDKASSEEDNLSEADTSNQLRNHPSTAEDHSQKGNPIAEPEDKESHKNFQFKKKGQNSFTPINYDDCSFPFHSFEASAPNSYPHQQ